MVFVLSVIKFSCGTVLSKARPINDIVPFTSVRSYSTPDHIQFAADNEATLYVNGIQRLYTQGWDSFAYKHLSLKTGDVIGIKVRDFGGWYGVIAELTVDGRQYVTGRDDWLAIKPTNPKDKDWLYGSYPARQICSWRRVEVRPSERHWFGGKSYHFNDPTAARYVWANGGTEGDTIFLRYRIGGENCAISSKILFAGDNVATLFVNGDAIGSLVDWNQFDNVSATLTKGDVVALKVKDYGGWYGAIVAIKSGGWYSTGKGEWRAAKKFTIFGDADAWTRPEYNACRWQKPVIRYPNQIVDGKSKDFPYKETGAEYVWAADAGEGDEIFLRTVIGVQC